MSAKPTLEAPSNTSPILSPFQNDFDPASHAKGKSHFQLVFCSIREKWRKQAVIDFYAFCRLADDLADEEKLNREDRLCALESIKGWLKLEKKIGHDFWDRLLDGLKKSKTPLRLLEQILTGIESDLKEAREIRTWQDLNDYCQAVAGDVGEVVLHLIGAWNLESPEYARRLGRCVQYLNILRDLEDDFKENRIYVPKEILAPHRELSWDVFQQEIPRLRQELYQKAMLYRESARPYSWKCFPSEMMVNFYVSAAQQYWIKGHSKKLHRLQKFKVFIRSLYRSFWACKKFST
jgi:phytoene synthase